MHAKLFANYGQDVTRLNIRTKISTFPSLTPLNTTPSDRLLMFPGSSVWWPLLAPELISIVLFAQFARTRSVVLLWPCLCEHMHVRRSCTNVLSAQPHPTTEQYQQAGQGRGTVSFRQNRNQIWPPDYIPTGTYVRAQTVRPAFQSQQPTSPTMCVRSTRQKLLVPNIWTKASKWAFEMLLVRIRRQDRQAGRQVT